LDLRRQVVLVAEAEVLFPLDEAGLVSRVEDFAEAIEFGDASEDLFSLLLLLGRRQVDGGLVATVEEGEELVELALGDGVVLMIVTLSTADGQAEEDAAGGVDAINDELVAELLLIDAAFLVEQRVAMEAGRDFLVSRPLRDQVAGNLVDDELIEGQ